ncbi:glycosyltransferase family 4 protein [Leeia oryzae]|uniref:glycosyltransferase family 4 protein n=1 Tax=Leeia oryzae TaxID=356662 RepID=UPI00037E78D8|nr:glycosyltransferase family 4 protein [Leeia oryzae]
MLTVLHTESSTGWGGQENRTLQESIQLKALGHRVLIACSPGSRLLARAAEEGIEVFEIPFLRGLRLSAVPKLQRLMREQHVDVLNTHSSRDTIVAGLAARLMRCGPVVIRTRHLIMPITSKSTYSLLPHHVVAVSDAVRDYLVSAGVDTSRVSVIRTGIDPEKFNPDNVSGDLKAELGLDEDIPLVGSVSILRIRKGHRHLLEAIPEILARMPQTHFVLAGDGPQFENLKKIVQEQGLNHCVHFLGLRRDIPNILKSLDVFVLPTYDEALGTAFLEAQAMETAVIGTRTGGVPETMQEGVTGLLVPTQNPTAISEAVIALLEQPGRAHDMGKNGRQFILSNFTVKVMAAQMLNLYQQLLQVYGLNHKK